VSPSGYDDEYSESLETEFRRLEAALLSDKVTLLAPSAPIHLAATATVAEALDQMIAKRRTAVVVVDGAGRLIGILNERDGLTRVVAPGRDLGTTTVGEVMTSHAEALAPDDRICHAVNRMNVGGYRTVPLVDAQRRPVGIVTTNDVTRWLAEIFPEAILNLRPGDRIKRPTDVDAG
jgi:CBS domain-containing protein